jgi:hypothetical protein
MMETVRALHARAMLPRQILSPGRGTPGEHGYRRNSTQYDELCDIWQSEKQ